MQEEFPEVECGICGHDGGPYAGCHLCQGNAPTQKRAHRLSEERKGMIESDRYGPGGEVGPKVVNLPGSSNPYGVPVAKPRD